ncbi:hypothetical protein [Fundicoccus culcitae]|uniref:Uncharacterized protein n=1 Tax=Fundicoccus culcitae TaxID=2969821 RepID=A0ABY5P3V3_9LACT|nr:hypothetical protein [Fundicoccus culcitae]UUX33414.1 hypothetical protein NRE15_10950 [Fundicoccus culcitae]
MESSILKDWQFRYMHVFKKRYTNKQKTRFIKSVLSDISQFRDDITVTELKSDKRHKVRNIYIGNVKKADIVISTYYDTPSKYFGNFQFFNTEKMQKQTLWVNVLSSLVLLILGVLYTMYIAIPILNQSNMLLTLLVVAGYLLFFWLLSIAAGGHPKPTTRVRNSASILYLLQSMNQVKSKKVAFALVDYGCKNSYGLEGLLAVTKPTSQVYYLDSFASKQELFVVPGSETDVPIKEGKRDVTFIISAKKTDNTYILEEADLTEVDEEKFAQVDQVLKL